MTLWNVTLFLPLMASGLWLGAGALFCENALRIKKGNAPAKAKPIRGSNSSDSAGSNDVEIAAEDGAILRATFHRGGHDCVLLLHGISDSRRGMSGFAHMFANAGYSVLIPDGRAHGESDGDLTTFGVREADDVLAWASWLEGQGCTRLFGLGESLGGSVLIQAAARKGVFAAIVAECPFRDLPSIAEHRVSQLISGPAVVSKGLAKAIVSAGLIYARLRYGLDLREASPVSSAKQLQTPLLLIHGLEDWSTPVAHSRAIAGANPRVETWFVPAAGHSNAYFHEPIKFRERVLAWFERSGTPYLLQTH